MKISKYGIAAIAIVLCATAALFLSGKLDHVTSSASADDVKPVVLSSSEGGSWVSRCQDVKNGEKTVGRYCEAVQQLLATKKDADPSTAQRVAEMAVGYPPGSDDAKGVVVVPLGVLVQEKVVAEVDGDKEFSFPIQFCDANGCLGLFDLSKGNIAKLRKGSKLTIKTKAVGGQPIEIGLSLNGFGSVIDGLKPKE